MDYLIRSKLLQTSLLVTRVFRVPGSFELGQLHSLLQILMGWRERCPYEFKKSPRRKLETAEPLEEFLNAGSRIFYHYKDGDGWPLQLDVLREYRREKPYPECLSGMLALPREGCGGVTQLEKLVALTRKPKTADPDGLRKKAGRHYATRFDLLEAQTALAREFGPPLSGFGLLGRYVCQGLSIRQAMVAALLEARQPLSFKQMVQRLLVAGVALAQGATSLKKSWQGKGPIVMTDDEKLDLDSDDPEFRPTLKAMKAHRIPAKTREVVYAVDSFPSQIGDKDQDAIVVVEEPGSWNRSQRVARPAQPEQLVQALAELIEERGRPALVAVRQREVKRLAASRFDIPVEQRAQLAEVEKAFFAAEARGLGPDRLSYEDLAQEVLAEFARSALIYYLDAPWLSASPEQLLRVEGLTQQPVYCQLDRFQLRVLADPGDDTAQLTLRFLDREEAGPLLLELRERLITVADEDALPYLFTPEESAGPDSFQLINALLMVLFSTLGEEPSEPVDLEMPFYDGSLLQVRWPVPALATR